MENNTYPMKHTKYTLLPNTALPALPIWLDGGEPNEDEYAEFFPEYDFRPGISYALRIAADGEYNVYLDGALVGFGQYADYPSRLIYDDVPLPVHPGSCLHILAWHLGVNSQTHVSRPAYAVFCLLADGIPLPGTGSSASTASRLSPDYVQHARRIITSQLGLGFSLTSGPGDTPMPSALSDVEFDAVLPRPCARETLGAAVDGKTVREGLFAFGDGARPTDGCDTVKIMSSAVIDVGAVNGGVTDVGSADGRYFLFDFGRETVGFPDISFNTHSPCRVYAAWGEHITDGFCRAAIHSRRFTFEYTAHAGDNRITPALRRLGCRYIQLFFDSQDVSAVRVSILPVIYPTVPLPSPLTGMRARIRDTALYTLECCMHEHYEDCPWREQALYTLDSRNQMLAGYYAFRDGNAAMVRASLDLMSRGVRKDGIMSLCFPAGLDYPIPYYSLAYFIQMNEYIVHTGDTSLAREHRGMLTRLIGTFLDRCDGGGDTRGLCRRFPDADGYWNFYEWSPSMSGDRIHKNTPPELLPYEAPLCAYLVLALRAMSDICRALGDAPGALEYDNAADVARDSLARVFFDRERGVFRSFTDRADAPVSVLTQAFCLLAGADVPAAMSREQKNAMLHIIASNGEGSDAVPATLSMACFRYDALLAADRDRWRNVILAEIDCDGEYMLSRGATTFWETIKGEADFGGAGSLCHGWSAMSIYYYAILGT